MSDSDLVAPESGRGIPGSSASDVERRRLNDENLIENGLR